MGFFGYPSAWAPDTMYLVRHGDCEKHGSLEIHSSEWALTEQGVRQARCAGEWLKSDVDGQMCRYLVGPYLRLRQSAGLLGLLGANKGWEIKEYLRPRGRGRRDYPAEGPAHRHMLYGAEVPEIDGGESVAAMKDRAQRLLDSVYREGSRTKRVVVVTSREVIWAIQANLEGWPDEEFARLLQRERRSIDEDLLGGEIIQYSAWLPGSRVMPCAGEGRARAAARWLLRITQFGKLGVQRRGRSFCCRRRVSPMNLSRSTDWKPFSRRRLSDDELLELSA